VQGNTLTISGERTNLREAREADFLQREITYGSFTRSLVLPEGVTESGCRLNIAMASWKLRRR
jgi:HSP20 family molecular chaperone IbpA